MTPRQIALLGYVLFIGGRFSAAAWPTGTWQGAALATVVFCVVLAVLPSYLRNGGNGT